MRFKLHRVAPNSEGWVRPSNGRLGQNGVGDYVRKHGFGHEDWNFNFDLAANGQMLGYTAAKNAGADVGQKFGLILATYDAGGWRAAGYYDQATLLSPSQIVVHETAVEQMAADVYQLAANNQTNTTYADMTFAQILEVIRTEFIYFRWSAATENVHVFRQPLPIPKHIFNPGIQRMTVSYDLSEDEFRAISNLGDAVQIPTSDEEGIAEGERILKVHKTSERNANLVAQFKRQLTTFACVICGFDFGKRYGKLGAGYIECHHTKPVAEMKPGDKTKLTDLCAVCSNCHRMIHRSTPMLGVEQFRRIIQS